MQLYKGFVDAIRDGDLAKFDYELYWNKDLNIVGGRWFCLERCRFVCLRVLFKKV